MILLIIPTRHEAAGIASRLRPAPALPGMPKGTLHVGRIGTADVTLLICGMGPAAAARTVRTALASLLGIDSVILAGYAGGLDPALRVGDLVVKSRGEAPAPGEFRAIPAILDAAEVVADIAAKAEAFKRTGAPVVDMESRAVEGVLADHPGLPFHIIRVVSDAAEHHLPSETLSYGYDMATSRETPARMALHLMRRPGAIFELVTFLKRLPPANRRLTEFLLDRLPELAGGQVSTR